jgi:hypothetical protein
MTRVTADREPADPREDPVQILVPPHDAPTGAPA